MAQEVAVEPCQARRGLDFMTAILFSANDRHQQDTFDFCISLADRISPSIGWRDMGRSRHFERVFQSDVGMRIELSTASGVSSPNAGLMKFDLPGAFFYLQDEAQVMAGLWELLHRDGFKHCSRLDFMSTELDPEWPVDRVHQGLTEQELWVKGYGSWRDWSERDFAGDCPDGRTIYWGSPRADRQGRTYDKAKQSGWRTPAIRDEVQLRAGWAKAFTDELRLVLRANLTGADMNDAVNDLAVAALNKHLQYWTLNGANPQTDKNWQRVAEPADWFQQRIGKATTDVRKVPVAPLGQDAAVRAGVVAYGPTFARQIVLDGLKDDLGLVRALLRLGGRFLTRLKPQEFVDLLGALPEERRAELLQQFQELLNACALEEEHAEP